MDQPASDRPTGYLRPHDAFACGHEQGCRPGPTARGECCAQDDCAPVRVESRWVCRRSVARGGPCESGPGPNGECGVPGRKCQPRMSLRVKRARLVIVSLGIEAGVTNGLHERRSIGLSLFVLHGRRLLLQAHVHLPHTRYAEQGVLHPPCTTASPHAGDFDDDASKVRLRCRRMDLRGRDQHGHRDGGADTDGSGHEVRDAGLHHGHSNTGGSIP